MKLKVVFLTCYLCYLPCMLLAAPPSSTNPQQLKNEPAQKEGEIGNKKEWVKNIEQTLPILLCNSEKYFVTCFSVTQQECTEFTKLLVHACVNNAQLAIPPVIDNHQGEYWGQMIGKCSYDLYEKFMQSKKLPKPGCSALPAHQDDLPQPSQATP